MQATCVVRRFRTLAETAALREAETSILREAREEARRAATNLGRASDFRRESDARRGYAGACAAHAPATKAMSPLPQEQQQGRLPSILSDLDRHIELFDLALSTAAAPKLAPVLAPTVAPAARLPATVLPELPSPFAAHVQAPPAHAAASASRKHASRSSAMFMPLHDAFAVPSTVDASVHL